MKQKKAVYKKRSYDPFCAATAAVSAFTVLKKHAYSAISAYGHKSSAIAASPTLLHTCGAAASVAGRAVATAQPFRDRIISISL